MVIGEPVYESGIWQIAVAAPLKKGEEDYGARNILPAPGTGRAGS